MMITDTQSQLLSDYAKELMSFDNEMGAIIEDCLHELKRNTHLTANSFDGKVQHLRNLCIDFYINNYMSNENTEVHQALLKVIYFLTELAPSNDYDHQLQKYECPLSGELLNNENKIIFIASNYIYDKHFLLELYGRQKDGEYTDPMTRTNLLPADIVCLNEAAEAVTEQLLNDSKIEKMTPVEEMSEADISHVAEELVPEAVIAQVAQEPRVMPELAVQRPETIIAQQSIPPRTLARPAASGIARFGINARPRRVEHSSVESYVCLHCSIL